MTIDFLTTAEASQRWCPMVRFVIPLAARVPGDTWSGAPLDNRGLYVPISEGRTCCIARACMAWRDVGLAQSGREDTGYCGLAGVPT